MSADAHTTAKSGGTLDQNRNSPFPNRQPADPRTCGACALWRVIPGEGEIFGECACDEMRDALGTEGCPRFDFGCRFFVPADPAAYRAALVGAGVLAVFHALYGQAGRTSLPATPDGIGRATRERLEIAVVRVLQAAQVLP